MIFHVRWSIGVHEILRKRIFDATHRTLEVGAGLNRNDFANDVAFNLRSRCQAHLQTAHCADDLSGDDNVVSNDFALDDGLLSYRQQVSTDITFDCTFKLNIAGAAEITDYRQVCAKKRRARLGLGGWHIYLL